MRTLIRRNETGGLHKESRALLNMAALVRRRDGAGGAGEVKQARALIIHVLTCRFGLIDRRHKALIERASIDHMVAIGDRLLTAHFRTRSVLNATG